MHRRKNLSRVLSMVLAFCLSVALLPAQAFAVTKDDDPTTWPAPDSIYTAPDKNPVYLIPCVMDMQDITLARDIVQLVFRSALRNHGETQQIDLWLLQPPNGVIKYLRDYFHDCRIQEYTELPECCRLADDFVKWWNSRVQQTQRNVLKGCLPV